MNHSLYSIDRATHFKIIGMALLSAIAVVALSLLFHRYSAPLRTETAVVAKAGKPILVSGYGAIIVR